MSATKPERRKWRTGWSQQLIDLLARRPELRGVVDVADTIDEAIRWSA